MCIKEFYSVLNCRCLKKIIQNVLKDKPSVRILAHELST